LKDVWTVVKEDTAFAVQHLTHFDALKVGVHLGEALEADGKFEEAASYYQEAAGMVPARSVMTHGRHHSAHSNAMDQAGFTAYAALAWKRAGDYEKAEVMYRSALQTVWAEAGGVFDKSMRVLEYDDDGVMLMGSDNEPSLYERMFENLLPNMHTMY